MQCAPTDRGGRGIAAGAALGVVQAGGDRGDAYYAHPTNAGPHPGVVVIHHMPGWDEWTCEVARKFAHHGYAAIAPSLYFRVGDGADEAVVAKIREGGGVAARELRNREPPHGRLRHPRAGRVRS